MNRICPDKDTKEQSGITLLKDSQWCLVDGEICRVLDFIPMGLIKNGKIMSLNRSTPYASIHLECKKLSDKITAFITHKMDFTHLWMAFKERTIQQNEEVLIIWSKKHYKSYAKLFSTFMPRIWVMVCPKGAFELYTDPSYRPELQGEARWNAQKPIADWKPEVMK